MMASFSRLQKPVLVLNASYEAVNVVPARRAIRLVLKGSAMIERRSASMVRTSRMAWPVPSVIRLLVYRRVPRRNQSVSRKNIMLRDHNTCQYCHVRFRPGCLTLDHVIPRSRGGADTWENLVACCRACNNRKADRTPAEAGMPLPRKPVPLSIHARHRLLAADPAWEEFLFS